MHTLKLTDADLALLLDCLEEVGQDDEENGHRIAVLLQKITQQTGVE